MTHRSILSELDALESEGRYHELSVKILSLMMKDVDLSPLAGKVIKFLAVPYPAFKKIIYTFLIRYSLQISDLNILATNSLQKDFKDPNPYLRRLVIKTACSITCLSELAFQLLPHALNDINAYVRSSAATSSSLVINSENLENHQEIIHKLYEMIRDQDPSVVCSTLLALEDILSSEGGVVINAKIVHYLLTRAAEFTEHNFAVIHRILKKYAVKNREELLSFLNSLDSQLLDSNPAVFLLAADVVLSVASQLLGNLSHDILYQITPQLKLRLENSSDEGLLALLDAIECCFCSHCDKLSGLYDLFFCNAFDTPHVKSKKLKLLPCLSDESNSGEILDEVLLYCCNANPVVSSQAIASFAKMHKQHRCAVTNYHMKSFISLLDIRNNNLNEHIMDALVSMDIGTNVDVRSFIMSSVSQYADTTVTTCGKASLLKFMGKFGCDIPNSPYVLEKIYKDIENCESDILMSLLISATVKLFQARPGETQLLLGSILQNAASSSNAFLKMHAAVHYNFLKFAIAPAKEISLDYENDSISGLKASSDQL